MMPRRACVFGCTATAAAAAADVLLHGLLLLPPHLVLIVEGAVLRRHQQAALNVAQAALGVLLVQRMACMRACVRWRRQLVRVRPWCARSSRSATDNPRLPAAAAAAPRRRLLSTWLLQAAPLARTQAHYLLHRDAADLRLGVPREVLHKRQQHLHAVCVAGRLGGGCDALWRGKVHAERVRRPAGPGSHDARAAPPPSAMGGNPRPATSPHLPIRQTLERKMAPAVVLERVQASQGDLCSTQPARGQLLLCLGRGCCRCWPARLAAAPPAVQGPQHAPGRFSGPCRPRTSKN